MPSRLLHLPEIAERTAMPVDTLRWLRHRGQLPFLFKLGRRVVAYEAEVDQWIAQQREATRTT